MDALNWLIGRRLQLIVHREYDWVFTFDERASLTVGCLWRLIEDRRIRFTSEDEAQWFGLPTPVDAAAELARRIASAAVTSVELHEYKLDLEMRFDTTHALQIIPDSSGYEAWTATDGVRLFIATGGGELAVFDG